MSDPRIDQRVKAESGGIAQVAGGDQENVSARSGSGPPTEGRRWAKWLAVLFGVAAVALLVLAAVGAIDWKVVAVPLIVAFLIAAGSAIAAAKG